MSHLRKHSTPSRPASHALLVVGEEGPVGVFEIESARHDAFGEKERRADRHHHVPETVASKECCFFTVEFFEYFDAADHLRVALRASMRVTVVRVADRERRAAVKGTSFVAPAAVLRVEER